MAVYFDGTQYISVSDDAALSWPIASLGVTCSFWVRVPDNDYNGMGTVFYHGVSSAGNHKAFCWIRGDQFSTAPGRFTFGFSDGTNTIYYTPTFNITGNTNWVHVLVTITTGGLATFYFNGTSRGTQTIAGIGDVNPAGEMRFGLGTDDANWITGEVAEFAILNGVLGAGPRAELAVGACPVNYPNILAVYGALRATMNVYSHDTDTGIWTPITTTAYNSPTVADHPKVEDQSYKITPAIISPIIQPVLSM